MVLHLSQTYFSPISLFFLSLSLLPLLLKIPSLCVLIFGWLQVPVDYSQICLFVLDLSSKIQVAVFVCLVFPL